MDILTFLWNDFQRTCNLIGIGFFVGLGFWFANKIITKYFKQYE